LVVDLKTRGLNKVGLKLCDELKINPESLS